MECFANIFASLSLLAFCAMLVGCATCGTNPLRLPDGYELVQDGGSKFRVKCPDGHVTDAQWETEDGATGYAISYDSFRKGSGL